MDIALLNKYALVGGASAGIGRAVALEMAALGANVTLLARTESALQATLQLLSTSQGQQHGYFVADFAQPAGLLEQVQRLLERRPSIF